MTTTDRPAQRETKMSEPYLIAHLVRGEPAFDIAIRLQIGDEEGWIIPTSGHRAYPYWEMPLMTIAKEFWCVPEYGDVLYPAPPHDWPDHYSSTPAPKGQGLLTNLASLLGLAPKGRINRR